MTLEPLLSSKTPYKQAHGVGAVSTVRYNFTCNPSDSINTSTLCTATDNTCNTCFANPFIRSVSNSCSTEGSLYRISPSTITTYLNSPKSGTYYIGLYVQAATSLCNKDSSQSYCSTNTDTENKFLCMQATYRSGTLTALKQLDNGTGTLTTPASAITTLYAGTQSGKVNVSSDGGANWAATKGRLDDYPVNSVFVSGTTIYAATTNNNSSLYKSTNGGNSWTLLTQPYPFSAVNTIFVSGSTIYAGTANGNIEVSTDDGVSWNQIPSPDTGEDPSVFSVFVHGATIYAATNNGNNNIMKSTDNGATWNPTTSPDGSGVNSVFVSGNAIYAGTENGNVELSTDGGDTWNQTTPPDSIDNPAVTSVFVSSTTIYAGTTNGNVEVSTDAGANWVATTQPDGTSSVNTVFVSSEFPNVAYYAGTQNGNVEVSLNGGVSWTSTTKQPDGSPVNSVFVSGTNNTTIYAATSDGNVMLSTDGGENWSALPSYPPFFTASLGSLFVSGTTIYLTSLGGEAAVSLDSGLSWSDITPAEYSECESLVLCPSPLFASGSSIYVFITQSHFKNPPAYIYESTDAGNSYTTLLGPGLSSTQSLFVNGQYMYAVTSGEGNLYISTDLGNNWPSSAVVSNVGGVYVSGNTIYAFGSNQSAGPFSNSIITSTDGGITWTSNITSPDNSVVNGFFIAPYQEY